MCRRLRQSPDCGSDRFYLLSLCVFALRLNAQIIPDAELLAVVLSACESALVLAHLLHAEELTPAARTATYDAARRFMKKLLFPAFKNHQRSWWGIIKFRMMFWIVNGLSDGAPGSTDSSEFEAALRTNVSRILKRASGNLDCMCDVVQHYIMCAMFDRLRSVEEPVADALAAASKLPARSRLLKQCQEIDGNVY